MDLLFVEIRALSMDVRTEIQCGTAFLIVVVHPQLDVNALDLPTGVRTR
jgi:hypothetical protein